MRGKKTRSASLEGADKHKVPEIVKKGGEKRLEMFGFFFPKQAKCCARGFAGIGGRELLGTRGA